MRLAMYQPDIAGNVGTILRLCACLGVPADVIEPCGFPLGDRQLRRAAMDYGSRTKVRRHVDWGCFETALRKGGHRLVLLTTKASLSLYDCEFAQNDVLLMGSEGAGVPDEIAAKAQCRVRIPMQPGMRSLNVAVAAGMALGEAVRQTGMPVLERE